MATAPSNPIELISLARKRIAWIAALRAAIYFVAPVLTAIAIGALLPAIGAITWERMGYVVSYDVMFQCRAAMIAAGLLALMVGMFRAWRAHSRSDDFVGAAIQVDDQLRANQQIVTLATLANPDAAASSAAEHSPLFPMLLSRVGLALRGFDPEREFAADLGQPVKKSWLPTAAFLFVAVFAMLALVRIPSPLEQSAVELHEMAAKMEAAADTPEQKQLAKKIKQVARALTNPNVPPEEKKNELAAVLAQVEKKEASAGDQSSNGASTGASSGAGTSSSKSSGGTEGKGEGGQSQGQGKGTGKGEGKGGSGSAQNQDGKKNGNNKGGADSVELKNELAKAQAQVQTKDLAANQAPNKPAPDAKTAQAPMPGNDPNQKGGSSNNPNEKGSAPMPVPQAGNNGSAKMPGQPPRPNSGGTGGDTHLGEFPTAGNYQRFLKPGEKGVGLSLNEARYVVFKIPPAMTSTGDGKTVIDTERPKATTAYTNAPLAPTSDTAPPDERQLVPPRYRDLIH